jgi:hypothetical protein
MAAILASVILLDVMEKPPMSRAEVAHFLGVSDFKVRLLENSGHLHWRAGKVNGKPTRFFDPQEVENLLPLLQLNRRRAVKRDRAAAVFEAFSKGKTLPDIVIELREDPAYVRRLWKEYATPLPAAAPATTTKPRLAESIARERAKREAQALEDWRRKELGT